MKIKGHVISGFLMSVVFVTASCTTNDKAIQKAGNDGLLLPDVPYVYDHSITLTDDIPTLGRVLFYDPRLSADNSVSCASCHKQNIAFADNVAFSAGIGLQKSRRNALTIQNERNPVAIPGNTAGNPFDSVFLFWDGRERILQTMVLDPIVNSAEMGNVDINTIIPKISNFREYQDLFNKAYGTPSVDKDKIALALTVFIQNFQSNTSAFDNYRNGVSDLTASEKDGHFLFLTKYNCNSCHQVENAPDSLNNYSGGRGFVDIGLDSTTVADKGRADVTGLDSDIGKFKIPTLRNVALTAPYMHDGRFTTLGEVLDHYSHGIANSPNLDVRLKTGTTALRMNISDSEKQDLIAFLNTLTDQKMLTDQRLSNPFPPK